MRETPYVERCTAGDKTLGMPRLIPPSVQVSMRGGQMPPPEDNGVRYLKIPLDTLRATTVRGCRVWND